MLRLLLFERTKLAHADEYKDAIKELAFEVVLGDRIVY